MVDYQQLVATIREARLEAHRRLMPGFNGAFDRYIADAVLRSMNSEDGNNLMVE